MGKGILKVLFFFIRLSLGTLWTKVVCGKVNILKTLLNYVAVYMLTCT
jgi:hypothetical protein